LLGEGLMTLQELQNQALQLPLGDRWRLVQSLLSSIQQETLVLSPFPKVIKEGYLVHQQQT
jgi:hypothetical protein